VQNWIDGVTPNGGFFLKSQVESDPGIAFFSAQGVLLANRPRLLIDTLVPPVPEPASFLSIAAGLCLLALNRKRRRTC
jgi:hypothetical protein